MWIHIVSRNPLTLQGRQPDWKRAAMEWPQDTPFFTSKTSKTQFLIILNLHFSRIAG